jgi:hypothetical protein
MKKERLQKSAEQANEYEDPAEISWTSLYIRISCIKELNKLLKTDLLQISAEQANEYEAPAEKSWTSL